MSNRIEWCEASMGMQLVTAGDLEEMSPDGNEDRDIGLPVGEGAILYGSPEELRKALTAALKAVEKADKPETRMIRYVRHFNARVHQTYEVEIPVDDPLPTEYDPDFDERATSESLVYDEMISPDEDWQISVEYGEAG